MSNDNTQKTNSPSMRDSVMKNIEENRVRMEPRWHFTLRAALFAVGAVLVFLASVYFASFVVFTLRQTGVWFVPGIGLSGVPVFLRSLPWVLVGVAIVFMVLLQVLTRRYAFSYARPFTYSALAIVVLVIVSGVAVGYTGFHGGAFPPDTQMRQAFGQRPGDVTTGTVVAVHGSTFELQDMNRQFFTIATGAGTQIPDGTLFPGDVVVVIGARVGNTVHASGVARFDHHAVGAGQLPPLPPQ